MRQRRSHMSDPLSRGLDIYRLQLNLQLRSARLLIACAVGVAGAAAYLHWEYVGQLDHQWIYQALAYWFAGLLYVVLLLDLQLVPVLTEIGWQKWYAHEVWFSEHHLYASAIVLEAARNAALVGLAAGIAILPLGIWVARRRGRDTYADLVTRGPKLATQTELDRLVRQGRDPRSRIAICDVRLPEKVLNRHILLLGSTRSGKSLSIRRMLREIQKRGDLVIAFDKVGDVVAEFYEPERGDLLFNPVDRRSPPWSPWCEGELPIDHARIAASLIPKIQNDKNIYFTEGARSLFVALLDRIGARPDRSLLELLKLAFVGPKEKLGTLLQGTEAAKHYSGTDAGSDVDATMAVFVQALRFLPLDSGKDRDVSIARFVRETIEAREMPPHRRAERLGHEYADLRRALRDTRQRLVADGPEAAIRTLDYVLRRRWPLFPAALFDAGGRLPPAPFSRATMETLERHWHEQDARIDALEAADLARIQARTQKTPAPWLFLSTSSGNVEALRPLIAAWIDVAVTAILSLPPKEDRRIWIILDEWHTLQKVAKLQDLLAEGAKYGACVIAGTQNIGQLRALYGRDEAEVMLSLFGTKAIFRLPEPDSAQWASRLLGDQILSQASETVRYGTSETMDGASVSANRAVEPLVMPADIMERGDLEAYLSIQGRYPTALVKTERRRSDAQQGEAAHFAARPFGDLIWHHIGDDLPMPTQRRGATDETLAPDGTLEGAPPLLAMMRAQPGRPATPPTAPSPPPAPARPGVEAANEPLPPQPPQADPGGEPGQLRTGPARRARPATENPARPDRDAAPPVPATNPTPTEPPTATGAEREAGREPDDPELDAKILELHRQGISQRQIAADLGTSRRRVARVLKDQ